MSSDRNSLGKSGWSRGKKIVVGAVIVFFFVFITAGYSLSRNASLSQQVPSSGLTTTLPGKYVNEALGFEMNAPTGWTTEYDPHNITHPPGSPLTTIIFAHAPEAESNNGDLNLVTKLYVDSWKLSDVTQPSSGSYSTSGRYSSCNEDESSHMTIARINDVKTKSYRQTCTRSNGVDYLERIYLYTDNYGIRIGYVSPSQEQFDTDYRAFHEALLTLSLKNADDISKQFTDVRPGEHSYIQNVTIQGQQYPVQIVSNYTMSNVVFNETYKRIDLDVMGSPNTIGYTIVTIPYAFTGPYSVTSDGLLVTPHLTVNDTTTDVYHLDVHTAEGQHHISVRGSLDSQVFDSGN